MARNKGAGPAGANLRPDGAVKDRRQAVVLDACSCGAGNTDLNSLGSLPAVDPKPEVIPAPARNVPRTRFWGKLGSPTVATVIAVIATAIALLSATVSFLQERSAERQNSIDQHQQLVSLVTHIVREPAAIQQARVSYKADETALENAIQTFSLAKFAQAEEAAGIIQSLHGQDVTSAEYYIVAIALEVGNDYALSLQFLDNAAARPTDVHGHVDALRESAKLLYQLGGPANIDAGERKIADAKAVINNALLMPDDKKKSALVYTYLFDAQNHERINCETANREFRIAQGIITNAPTASTPRINAELIRTQREISTQCLR
jgi:hypothetical protein